MLCVVCCMCVLWLMWGVSGCVLFCWVTDVLVVDGLVGGWWLVVDGW